VRGRFFDLVERQLELFESEHSGLLADIAAALDAYNASSADEAEALYGDYGDLVDTARDVLLEYRDAYARTLDADAAEEYEEVFKRLVRKRLPLGLEFD
jgi:hypothetical protein